jgi:Lrp/AsnC ligand binding domain
MEKNALPIKDEAAQRKSVTALAPVGSATNYVLVTLEPAADLPGVYRTLYTQEHVLSCDAIKGDYDLVLLVEAESNDKIREMVETKIKAVSGVAGAALLFVETPVSPEGVINMFGSSGHVPGRAAQEGEMYTDKAAKAGAAAYAIFEIEKEKLEAIYPVLYFNDQVVYCDFTRGKYDIVALMKGSGFAEIEHTIRSRFTPLDGVLRIKEWPIITLIET